MKKTALKNPKPPKKTVRRSVVKSISRKQKPNPGQSLAEQALLASERKFRTLFENMLEGFYQSTKAGKFLTVNPALVRMLGYESEKELLDVNISHDLYQSPEQRMSW